MASVRSGSASVVFVPGVGGARDDWQAPLLHSLAAFDVALTAVSYADLLGPEPPATETTPAPVATVAAPSADDSDEAARTDYIARQRDLVDVVAAAGEAATGTWPPVLPRPADLVARIPLRQLARLPVLGVDQAGRYLDDEQRRDRVLARVAAALRDAEPPIVVIGHSLGSVVVADLVADLPAGTSIAQVVTMGSPLGHAQMPCRLDGRPFPYARVGAWLNVVHPLDPLPAGGGIGSRFPFAHDITLQPAVGSPADLVTGHVDRAYLGSRTVAVAVEHAADHAARTAADS